LKIISYSRKQISNKNVEAELQVNKKNKQVTVKTILKLTKINQIKEKEIKTNLTKQYSKIANIKNKLITSQ
jgi:hypothetical protein